MAICHDAQKGGYTGSHWSKPGAAAPLDQFCLRTGLTPSCSLPLPILTPSQSLRVPRPATSFGFLLRSLPQGSALDPLRSHAVSRPLRQRPWTPCPLAPASTLRALSRSGKGISLGGLASPRPATNPTACASHIFPALLARVIGARTFLSAFARWSTPKPTGGQECPRSGKM